MTKPIKKFTPELNSELTKNYNEKINEKRREIFLKAIDAKSQSFYNSLNKRESNLINHLNYLNA